MAPAKSEVIEIAAEQRNQCRNGGRDLCFRKSYPSDHIDVGHDVNIPQSGKQAAGRLVCQFWKIGWLDLDYILFYAIIFGVRASKNPELVLWIIQHKYAHE
jgi:hypothetical protein